MTLDETVSEGPSPGCAERMADREARAGKPSGTVRPGKAVELRGNNPDGIDKIERALADELAG